MRSLKMRHQKSRSLNNRFTSWRKATIASLARSVLKYQSIKTTKIRASSAKPLVEKLISLAKENSLFAKRRAYEILGDHKLVSFLFSQIGPRFKSRTGGYTRILNLGLRRGDGAELAVLELTEIKKKEPKKPKKSKETKEQEIKEPGTVREEPPTEERKTKTEVIVKEERPPKIAKPQKKFLGGLRNIFKKERDFL